LPFAGMALESPPNRSPNPASQSWRSIANSIAKSADSASAFADFASGKDQETVT
jgi:hypothetical protein